MWPIYTKSRKFGLLNGSNDKYDGIYCIIWVLIYLELIK